MSTKKNFSFWKKNIEKKIKFSKYKRHKKALKFIPSFKTYSDLTFKSTCFVPFCVSYTTFKVFPK